METHALANKQKGRVGEALLTGHRGYATEIVEEWIAEQVRAGSEASDSHSAASETDRVRVTHDHRVETYYVQYEGDHMSWTPDCLFTAWVSKRFGPLRSSDERRIDYPVEIKSGAYAELERNQRRVMELLATGSETVPVLARIELQGLPDEFGVEFSVVPPASTDA